MSEIKEHELCVCCKGSKTSQRGYFNNQVHHKKFTVIDALNYVFGLKLKVDSNIRRFVCMECSKHLGNAYVYLQKLKNVIKEDSYIMSAKIIENSQIVQVPLPTPTSPKRPIPELKVRRVTQAPIVKIIKKYLGNKRSKETYRRMVKNHIDKEMKSLITVTALNPAVRPVTRENLIPSDKYLQSELENSAPLVYEVLRGLLGAKEFNPRMRTLIGVALNERNTFVNTFQKLTSITLYNGNASIKTFDLFNQLGITTSYKTCQNTLKLLSLDCDASLIKIKKEKEGQIQEEGAMAQYFPDDPAAPLPLEVIIDELDKPNRKRTRKRKLSFPQKEKSVQKSKLRGARVRDEAVLGESNNSQKNNSPHKKIRVK